jgi:hypothetical protein
LPANTDDEHTYSPRFVDVFNNRLWALLQGIELGLRIVVANHAFIVDSSE